MCDISRLFTKEFFAVRPKKHIGLSDMQKLIHMKIHELGTKGYSTARVYLNIRYAYYTRIIRVSYAYHTRMIRV